MDQIHYWSKSLVTISSSAWKQELMVTEWLDGVKGLSKFSPFVCSWPNLWLTNFLEIYEVEVLEKWWLLLLRKENWAISWDMVLFVLSKLILQMLMRSHPVGLGIWFLVVPFVCFYTYVCDQWRLWRDCEVCLSLRWSPVVIGSMNSCAGSIVVRWHARLFSVKAKRRLWAN